jgi:hypothetical protein
MECKTNSFGGKNILDTKGGKDRENKERKRETRGKKKEICI